MRATLLFLVVAGTVLAVGCDDRASQTTTTAAPGTVTSGSTATEDLKQAGRDLGSAAQKTAGKTGRAVADEAKREARDLDVKITTSVDAGR